MQLRSTDERREPLTYWEQYVESGPWYAKKMLEEVPQEPRCTTRT